MFHHTYQVAGFEWGLRCQSNSFALYYLSSADHGGSAKSFSAEGEGQEMTTGDRTCGVPTSFPVKGYATLHPSFSCSLTRFAAAISHCERRMDEWNLG